MSSTTKIDDGGPAFPQYSGLLFKGMSLRDYLAAQARPADVYGEDGTIGLPTDTAMALMGTKNPEYGKDPLGNARWFSEALARWKFMHADSMIAAAKRSDPLNGWRPASAPPDHANNVLVSNGETVDVGWYASSREWRHVGGDITTVTHWKPLPAPPTPSAESATL